MASTHVINQVAVSKDDDITFIPTEVTCSLATSPHECIRSIAIASASVISAVSV